MDWCWPMERRFPAAISCWLPVIQRGTAEMEEVGVQLQRKPFSVGVRIEHPQHLVDAARWGRRRGIRASGPPSTSWCTMRERTLRLHFCMCPGGFVVGATSEEGRVVTNGRASIPATSATPTAVWSWPWTQKIWPRLSASRGPAGGIALQQELESAPSAGGSSYAAPAQRLEDFLGHRPVLVPLQRRINRVCIPPIWMFAARPLLRPCGSVACLCRKLRLTT